MKPSWNDAPEWATHLAMDQDLRWSWHEHEPHWSAYRGRWMEPKGGRRQLAKLVCSPVNTLERRPEATV